MTLSNVIASDFQGLEVESEIIDLFQLIISEGDDGTPETSVYFINTTDKVPSGSVYFKDFYSPFTERAYSALPIILEGIEFNSAGALPQPTLTMANVTSFMSDSISTATDGRINKNIDLIGSKIVHRQTLYKHLNSGTLNVSGPIELPKRLYKLARIGEETNIYIKFELTALYDVEGVSIPRRAAYGKYCSWQYRGYYGSNYPHAKDNTGTLIAPESGASPKPKRGACTWRPAFTQFHHPTGTAAITTGNASSGYDAFRREFRPYYTVKNEPLIPEYYVVSGSSQYNTAGTTHFGQTYDSSQTYTMSSYVKVGSSFYRSKINNNVGNTPATGGPSDSYWQIAYTYAYFSNITATTVIQKNDKVEHNYTIWMCTKEYTKGTGATDSPEHAPSIGSIYWTLIEACGKTLASCKLRFQAEIASPGQTYTIDDSGLDGLGRAVAGTGSNVTNFSFVSGKPGASATSSSLNENIALPFGGWPSTTTFN
jgi:lambda family phage minor tail protein L